MNSGLKAGFNRKHSKSSRPLSGFVTYLRNCILYPLLLVWTASLHAQNTTLTNQTGLNTGTSNKVVPADTAFKLQAFVEGDENVVLLVDILPNYYLYRQSLSITRADGSGIDTADIPQGSHLTDEFFGDVEVYFDKLLITVPLEDAAVRNRQVHLQLGYQGCAKDLYCYPPQLKQIDLNLP